MSNKFKINPRTGKFDIVGGCGGCTVVINEEKELDVVSTDNSVSITKNVVSAQGEEPEKTEFDLSVSIPEFDTTAIDEAIQANATTTSLINERLVTVENNYKKRPSGDWDSEGCELHTLYVGDTSNDVQPFTDPNKDWLLIFKNFSCNGGDIFEEVRVVLDYYKYDANGTLSRPDNFPIADYLISIQGPVSYMGRPHVIIKNKFVKNDGGYKEYKNGAFTNTVWELKPEDIMLVVKSESANTHSTKSDSRSYDLYIKNNIQYACYKIYEMRRPVRRTAKFTYWCTNRRGVSNSYTNAANGINVSFDSTYHCSSTLESWCATTDNAHPTLSRREVLCRTTFNDSEITGTRYYGEMLDEDNDITYGISTEQSIKVTTTSNGNHTDFKLEVDRLQPSTIVDYYGSSYTMGDIISALRNIGQLH